MCVRGLPFQARTGVDGDRPQAHIGKRMADGTELEGGLWTAIPSISSGARALVESDMPLLQASTSPSDRPDGPGLGHPGHRVWLQARKSTAASNSARIRQWGRLRSGKRRSSPVGIEAVGCDVRDVTTWSSVSGML